MHSVHIIRTKDKVAEAVYLKEFFMFSGVYVSEKIVDDFKLGLELLVENNKEQYKMNLMLNKNEDLSDLNKRVEFGNRVLINQICEKLKERGYKEFEILAKIFIEKDYAYKNYFGNLYFKQMDKIKQLELARFYKDCFLELKQKNNESGVEDSVHFKFSYINCARKSNEVYDACNIQTLFNEEKLIEDAKKLLKKNDGFSIAKVLIGKIGLSLIVLWCIGEKYLKEAIQEEEKKEYSSFIYYRLGHFYEIEKDDLSKAKDIYLKIKEFDESNYRVLFKLGWINYYTNNLREAVKYFRQAYDLIKENDIYIQPIEMEYKWKCAFILAKSKLLRKYVDDISIYEKEVNNNFYEKSLFIEKFVNGSDVEMYNKYFENKVNMNGLNEIFQS